jgi:hypothetical protein
VSSGGEATHVGLELPLQAHDVARARRVLEPREGGLRGQAARVVGRAVARQAPERVVAERRGVVRVFIAEGDGRHALANLLEPAVPDAARGARVGQAGGDARAQPRPL